MGRLGFKLCLGAVLIFCGGLRPDALLRAQGRGDKLPSVSTILGTDAPYSFPEKAVVGPLGDIFILDTELSNVFFIDTRADKISQLCTPKAPGSPSDVTVDPSGRIWLLDSSNSNITRLNKRCEVQASFNSRRPTLKIQANAYGEIAALTTAGETLFDLYDGSGKFLRSFGQRTEYGDEIADTELNDGKIISDRAGGFYFSFNYPPLIRHYGRAGNLLGEFRPESDVEIGPPNVSSRKQGNRLTVSSHYQILVLDMALDRRNRLYLLISGDDKAQAVARGSNKLNVVTTQGKTLKKYVLEESYDRLAAGDVVLYLLRNRKPLRLEKYAQP